MTCNVVVELVGGGPVFNGAYPVYFHSIQLSCNERGKCPHYNKLKNKKIPHYFPNSFSLFYTIEYEKAFNMRRLIEFMR